MAVEQRRVGAVAQQQRADLHAVLRRCLVEGSELPQIHGVHAGSMLGGGVKRGMKRGMDGKSSGVDVC